VTTYPGLNDDFTDGLQLLEEHQVRYLVVGAHALAVHGIPRATSDIDIWVEPTADNASRVIAALEQFGAPLAAHGVKQSDFEKPGVVYQIGLPPRRIDILTMIDGVSFEQAWTGKIRARVDEIELPVIGRDELLANKLASGRPKDLLDVQALTEEE